MVCKLSRTQQQMSSSFENDIIYFFANFWESWESWDSETKHQKLFKSKFVHKNLRKWFRSFLELKNQYCGRLKIAFFSFVPVFDWRSWNHFPGKWGKNIQNHLNQNWVPGSFLENGFEGTLRSRTNMFWAFEKGIFQFFASF